jgi:oligoendopeptidase F
MATIYSDTLNWDALPLYQPRQFLSSKTDLIKKEDAIHWYQELLNRPIGSVKDLENWLLDKSELEAALDQTGAILYIRMTCQTDDQARAGAYQHFIETVIPAIKPLDDQLNKKLLESNKKFSLDSHRYGLYIKHVEVDVDLFVQENVPLQTKVDLLSQEYQTVCGAMTIHFKDKEHTLPQMSKYLFDPDRQLREDAWRAVAKRRLKDKEKLEVIFNEMSSLRNSIAKNARCSDFIEYKFRSLHRFDYSSKDCKEFHRTVETLVVPLQKQILEKRKKDMGLSSLRPWDTAVDPLGKKALKPFLEVSDLIEGCQKIFYKVNGQLGEEFEHFAKAGLLDLASRKGKAPGGYQSSLQETRQPFIFMNAVGVDDDVRTLMHEAGHAFHSMASRKDPLLGYRHGPMEFNEVASMAMELLAGEHIAGFYNQEDEVRSNKMHFEEIISLLCWVAVVDAFQHWMYENPQHTPEERKMAWLKTHARFGGDGIDWISLEEERSFLWHRQLHIFEVPFYYIEYGIAQLGALQVWLNSRKDYSQAVADYQKALSLGGSKPLPELYQTAGIRFDFSSNTIAPLMEAVWKELSRLG